MKRYLKLGAIATLGIFLGCDVESEIRSEILPEAFFKTEAQIEAAASSAYTPLYSYWDHIALAELNTDVATVPIRSNNGWDDGGTWPRLMHHEFDPNAYFYNNEWNRFSNGITACNRLIEIFTKNTGPETQVVYELRTLRAFYLFKLLVQFGNIPIESRFSDADPAPSQVSPQEAFKFIESELLASIDQLKEDKLSTYAKANKWVGYMILAKLYLQAEQITGIPYWQEAADAASVIIQSGAYALEPNYFANFKTKNEGSIENMFMIPYETSIANGFWIYGSALQQSADITFNSGVGPAGGFSIQEDFYNSYSDDDIRKNMFIVGQQYTAAAGPSFADDIGFYYTNPTDNNRLLDCTEDWDNFAATPEIQSQISSGCNVIITPGYQLLDGRYLYKNGARYGKFQIQQGISGASISADFPIFRYADLLLIRAEALWRMENGSLEALQLVNEIRERAKILPLTVLSEDDLYGEIKKELAMENHARETILRFGHWEDSWFLRDGNKEESKRIYPIPTQQLQANPSLKQNPGY